MDSHDKLVVCFITAVGVICWALNNVCVIYSLIVVRGDTDYGIGGR